MVSISSDITETKQADAALREGESALRSFFDSAGAQRGIVELERDDILHISDNAITAAFFGTTKESLRNKRASELGVPPEIIRLWIGHYRKSQQTGEAVNFDYAHRTRNGERWLTVMVSCLGTTFDARPRFAYVVTDITERKRAEERLREYEKVVEGLQEMIVVVDREYRYLLANQAFLDYRSLKREEVVGHLMSEVLNKDVFEEVVTSKLSKCFRGETVKHQLTYNCPKRGEIHLSISYFPIEGPEGFDRVACVLQDITVQRRAEDLVTTSEHQLAEAQHLAQVGSWNWDLASSTVIWSDELYRICGVNREEFDRTSDAAFQLVHPEDKKLLEAAMTRTVRDREPFICDHRVVRPDGEIRILQSRGAVALDAAGQPIRLYGTAQDITERKRNEEALRQAEQKYHDIFENAGEGIFQSTPDGELVVANPTLAAMLGFASPEELIRERKDALRGGRADPTRRQELIQQLNEQGTVRGFEHQVLRKDHSKIWVTVNARAVRDQQGTILYYEGTAQDISERKRAEVRSDLFSSLARKLSGARTQAEAGRIISDTSSELFGWDSCNLNLYDADLDTVYPLLNVDMIEGRRVDVTASLTPRKPTPRSRRVINHGPELTNREEPVKFDHDSVPFGDKSRPSASLMAVPICDAETVIGLLSIHSYAPGAYNNSDLRDLHALATYCGEALNRIRIEAALRQSEERFRELFESAKDAYYVHDLNGRYTSVNRAAEKLCGYPREEIIGKAFSDFIPPDQLETASENLCRKLIEKGETTYETEVLAGDGRHVPVEVSSHLVFENGVAVRVQGTARDITERKRAEEALRQSEREYRGLFENAHDAILIIHPEQEVVLEVNQRACEVYGISRSEFIGMSLEVISKNVEFGRSRIKETLERGTACDFETIQRRGDGTEMFLHINASVVEYKGQIAIQSINRDITDRKFAEQALKQSEERFSKAFHSSPSALSIAFLEDGRMLEVNAAFLRMTGFGREEVIGRSTLELGLWDGQHRLIMANALRQHGAVQDLEIKFRKKSGEVRDGLLSAELIQLGRGELCVLGIAQDVTERNRAEEAQQRYPRQLIEAQEAERQSIARELHDQIGQVLTAIHLNLQATREIYEPGEAKALIDEGVAIVDQALAQVRDLSFELRPSVLDDLGLVAALRWYTDRFAQRTGINANVTINLPNPPERLGSELETACFRIVQEALTNVVRHAKARNVSVKLKSLNDEIRLSIKDDGVGFDVFSQNLAPFTTHLGLRGMRERALAIGGRLEVKSSSSRGTMICAHFPNLRKKDSRPGRGFS